MDQRAVGNGILCPPGITVAAIALAHSHAFTAHHAFAHLGRLDRLQPLIAKAAAHGARKCFNKSHLKPPKIAQGGHLWPSLKDNDNTIKNNNKKPFTLQQIPVHFAEKHSSQESR